MSQNRNLGQSSAVAGRQQINSKVTTPGPVLSDWVDIVVSHIRREMPNYAEEWIENKLTPENVTSCSSFYNRCCKEIVAKHYFHTIPPNLREELRRNVLEKNRVYKRNFFDALFKPIVEYNKYLKYILEQNGYLTSDEFFATAKSAARNIEPCNDTQIMNLRSLGIQKIHDYHAHYNENIRQSETEIMNYLNTRLFKFYSEQIYGYISKHAVFTTNDLNAIHQNLLLIILKSACQTLSHTSNDVLPVIARKWMDNLEITLSTNFSSVLKSNQLTLKKFQLKISRALTKAYNDYVAGIEGVLQNNPEGCDVNLLKQSHNKIASGCVNNLKLEIRSNTRECEPVYGHSQALMHQLNQYWTFVMEANRQNSEKASQKHKVAQYGRKRAQSNPSNVRSTRLPDVMNPAENKAGTLIFKISHTYITIGIVINGTFKVLTNRYGESKTYTFVGINPQGDLDYGTKAYDLCKRMQLRHWWVTDYFGINSRLLDANESVSIKNQRYKISPEFLLAYLLRTLKISAENIVNDRISDTVVMVPFSYSCAGAHGTQIRDAAEIAGFSKVYLVNSETAGAYEYAKQWCDPGKNILMQSQTNGIVATILYYYDNDMNKTMTLLDYKIDHGSRVQEDFFSALCYNPNIDEQTAKTKLAKKTIKTLIRRNLRRAYSYVYMTESVARQDDMWLEVFRAIDASDIKIDQDVIGMLGVSIIEDASVFENILKNENDLDKTTSQRNSISRPRRYSIVNNVVNTPKEKREIAKQISNLLPDSQYEQRSHPKQREQNANESSIIVKAKSQLKHLCDTMENGVSKGKYFFKTEISYDLFRKKIQRARNLLQSNPTDVASIQKEIDELKRARSKYLKIGTV